MAEQAAPESFIGTWKLAAIRLVRPDGTVSHPFGDKPVGYLTYTADGRMHALFMHEDPAVTDRGTAYSATWEIRGNEVIHHVTAALVREWAGTDLPRSYAFVDGGLTLTAAEPDRTFELVWQRAG